MIEYNPLKTPVTIRKLVYKINSFSYELYTSNVLDLITEHGNRFLEHVGFNPVIKRTNGACSRNYYWKWEVISSDTFSIYQRDVICKYRYQILDGNGVVVDPKPFWDAYIRQFGTPTYRRRSLAPDAGNPYRASPCRTKNPRTTQKFKYHKFYLQDLKDLKKDGYKIKGYTRDSRKIEYDFLGWELKGRTRDVNWKRQRKTRYRTNKKDNISG